MRTRRVRTPTILQMDAAECGAVCLGIILRHYERFISQTELRQACGVSRDGTSAGNLVRAAREYNLETRALSTDLDGLRSVQFPAIVFWGFNHFVVAEGADARGLLLNDPASGHGRADWKEVEEKYTGITIALEPGPGFEPGGVPPNIWRAVTKRLIGFRASVMFTIGSGFLIVIPGIVLPMFSQIYIDRVIVRRQYDWLGPLLWIMAAVGIFHVLFTYLQLSSLLRLRLGMGAKASVEFFSHLLRLPTSFHVQRFTGELGSRQVLNDRVAELLVGRLAQTAIDLLMMVFFASAMFFYDVVLTLVGIGAACLNFAILRTVSSWRVEANMQVLNEAGRLQGMAVDGLSNMETLKASGLEGSFFSRWAGHYARSANAKQSMLLTNQMLNHLALLTGGVITVLVLFLGGLKVMNGEFSLGMLVAFLMLMGCFQRPVVGLLGLGQVLQDLIGYVNRLDDVLGHDVDTDEQDSAETGAGTGRRLNGALEFRDVSFSFGPKSQPFVQELSLKLEPGARTALVGVSGSGKSTIARIACGLYQPDRGTVLYDGQPRSSVPGEVRAASIALVDQDIVIFAGTVRDNLTLWDETLDPAVLERACEDAYIADRIQALPHGIETRLVEGGKNLSGGERQRLEIGRALACEPSLLVLDEATSALDPQVEHEIYQRIKRRGCTCLIAAHRLSTIRDCDEIVVLEGGRIVERGVHEELLARRGAYHQLIHAGHFEGGAA